MYTIVTGKPGSSKTSHVIDMIHFSGQFDGREIYYRGIKDLKVPWIELTDDETLRWPEMIPDNAVLIVDEAQELWPPRPAGRPVPEGLKALEKHRHRGLDIFFITQDPSLLDKHARTLANEHIHFSRPFGAPFVHMYHSGSGYVDPASTRALKATKQSKKPLPRRVFGLYHSAEAHTHKFRPPKMLFIVPLLALAAVFLGYRFISNFSGDGNEELVGSGSRVAPVVAQSESTSRGWAELLTPEIPDIPWTAPLYRERAMVVSEVPRLAACLNSESQGCICYTQQGTRINGISEQTCLNFIRYGQFDHMRERAGRGEGGSEARAAPSLRPVRAT